MATKKTGKPNGRPSKYDPKSHPVVARAMSRLGATQPEIAEALQVALSNMREWMKRYPEFQAAIKEGKALADSHVEDGLYRRALGYEYTETKVVEEANKVGIAIGRDENGKAKLTPAIVVRTETTTKQRAPDVASQIFWLKNRKPDVWRDVQLRELTGKDGEPISVRFGDISAQLLPELAGDGAKEAPRKD